MDYEAEYSCVMSALNDIDTELSQFIESHDMDRQAVEELLARLQVLSVFLCDSQTVS